MTRNWIQLEQEFRVFFFILRGAKTFLWQMDSKMATLAKASITDLAHFGFNLSKIV